MTRRHAERCSGVTFIEVMVAMLIATMTLTGLTSVWVVAFYFTIQSADTGAGYSLGRLDVERVKGIGFHFLKNGTQSRYFTLTSTGVTEVSDATGASYRVTTVIDTGHLDDGVFETASVESDQEMRRVIITVTALGSGEQVFDTVMYVGRGAR